MNRLEIFQKVYGTDYVFTAQELERLRQVAVLVASEEREACAKLCEDQITGYHFLAMRGHFDHMDQAATNCAAAIRARGRND